mgnify:FL=1
MIHIHKTKLEKVLLIRMENHEDHRGEYVETYNEKLYKDKGIEIDFVQDDYSLSLKHVLRGLHGDDKTWKLISCPYGKFYLVVVDLEEASPTYKQWEAFVLSNRNKKQVLIPPNHANGHLILSDMAIFQYKQSEYYDPKIQFSYRWDDLKFGISWPVKNPILSKRDEQGRYVD